MKQPGDEGCTHVSSGVQDRTGGSCWSTGNMGACLVQGYSTWWVAPYMVAAGGLRFDPRPPSNSSRTSRQMSPRRWHSTMPFLPARLMVCTGADTLWVQIYLQAGFLDPQPGVRVKM